MFLRASKFSPTKLAVNVFKKVLLEKFDERTADIEKVEVCHQKRVSNYSFTWNFNVR